jgi:hypothetical protein
VRVFGCDLGNLLRHGKVRRIGINRNVAPSATLVGAGMASPAYDHTVFKRYWTAHLVRYDVVTLRPLSKMMESRTGFTDGTDTRTAASTPKLLSNQGHPLYRCWKTLVI